MSPADLFCLYCQRPAFAVINIEITAGRGRWPVCRDTDCINRALFDGGIRLANAAGVRLATNAIEVAEAPRCEYVSTSPWGPTQCVLHRGHEEELHAFSPSETWAAIEATRSPCSTCGHVASDHGWVGDEHQQCTQCDCREYNADAYIPQPLPDEAYAEDRRSARRRHPAQEYNTDG